MKRATRVPLLCASLCFFPAATFAQTDFAVARQQPAASAKSSFTCRATFGPTMALPSSGTAAPYSAVQESSSVQTLADGTHITRKPTSEKIYRDAEGRSRTERVFCQGPGGVEATVIEIRDPVAGYSYILDEQNQIAHRFTLQAPHRMEPPVHTANLANAQPVLSSEAPQQQPARPTVTTESLGTQTMEGVLVEGSRTTRTIPEGLEGNDRPITVVSEVWRSPELKVAVVIKSNDPRNGEMTTRLTNIELSNPILSLFQPPSDYKIVDDTERISITYTRP
jgi:hypothetical protein